MDRQDGQDGRLCRGGGYAWAWIAAYAAMTGGWARFIAPLQKNLPLSGRLGEGHGMPCPYGAGGSVFHSFTYPSQSQGACGEMYLRLSTSGQSGRCSG